MGGHNTRIGWWNVLISALIAGTGWWGSHALTKVDQDIRIIHAEYTLAATDLGHMNARLIRYRSTIIRAIEADSKRQFESITESFPAQRQRIEDTLDVYIRASQKASSNPKVRTQEAAALIELREKLEQYIESSRVTLGILEELWQSSSPQDRRRLRAKAEYHAAQDAGPKLIAVSFALDRLLEIVAEIGNDARKESESVIRLATATVIGISFTLAVLVLFSPRGAGRFLGKRDPVPESQRHARRQPEGESADLTTS